MSDPSSVAGGELTARRAVDEGWSGSPPPIPGSNRFSLCWPGRPARGARPRRPREAVACAAAARRPDRDQGGDRRRRLGDDVRRGGERHAGRLVRRLRAAGAVVVGKTTMPGGLSSSRGVTRNPWDRPHPPAAAAVAAGMSGPGWAATGGRVDPDLQSASCGLFGLKPQRGRVTTAPHPDLRFAQRRRRPAAGQRGRLRRGPPTPRRTPPARAGTPRSRRRRARSRAACASAGR